MAQESSFNVKATEGSEEEFTVPVLKPETMADALEGENPLAKDEASIMDAFHQKNVIRLQGICRRWLRKPENVAGKSEAEIVSALADLVRKSTFGVISRTASDRKTVIDASTLGITGKALAAAVESLRQNPDVVVINAPE